MAKQSNDNPGKSYAAKLEEDLLYMLKLRAHEEIDGKVIALNGHLAGSRSEIRTFLSQINESNEYFLRLKECIGLSDKPKKKLPLKFKNVWSILQPFICKLPAQSLKAPVQIWHDGKIVYENDEARKLAADILGFDSFQALINAAATKAPISIDGDAMIDHDNLDIVAKVFNQRNWNFLSGKNDNSYLVSEGMLNKLYGYHAAEKPISKKNLDIIASFIEPGNSWESLLANKMEILYKIESRHIHMTSNMRGINRPKSKHPSIIDSSSLTEGDKVCITYDNDKTLLLKYLGNYDFLVLEHSSAHLQVGYHLGLDIIKRGESIRTNRILDGEKLLRSVYTSSRIKQLTFIPAGTVIL